MITLTAITDPIKLEEYFRFRYRIYSESRQVGFVATKGDGRDVDVFDERALHFGWYMNDTLLVASDSWNPMKARTRCPC
ncbi:MAG: hypothetical protein IPO17_15350 [Flavobacteriales bacterium]|nr:hypothetical protein [Flavobacteriales bacterium]